QGPVTLQINAGITSRGAISASGQDVNIAPLVALRSDAQGVGAGDLQITAAGSFNAAATSQLLGGSVATPTTAGVSATAGSASSGGDLIAGLISGKDVQLTTFGKTGGGSLTIGGAINAGHGVTILGDPGGLGQGPVTVAVASPITSAGGINIATAG